MELKEIIEQRKKKISSLETRGINPYPNQVPGHTTISQALEGVTEGRSASVCGRITAKRLHGKVVFLDLRDSSAKIQLYIKKDIVGEEAFTLFQEDLDIADIVQAEGPLFMTHSGEPTIKVERWLVLAKALRPLPEKWHGLKDVELRYRQRYLDLIANEEVRKTFALRSKVTKAIRSFLDNRGFLEVETPMMHPIAGGAAGRPFKTHHNEYNMDLYLRIAPELYLKRLLVAGMDKVYEINRSFRNEGVSTKHNPEFTMLELYCAYSDYEEMMRLTEELIFNAAKEVLGSSSFTYQSKTVDLISPWQKISFAKVVKERFDIEPEDSPADMLKKLQNRGAALGLAKLSRSQVVKVIEDILEEERNTNPTFVTDYFTNLCPLAKARIDNPHVSERFELYIAGMEIANAYTELNDPLEQRRRFQVELQESDADEEKSLDEDYILALEHGMPPAGGLGIGIDRLVMLLADQPSIRDVILFPLLRPTSE